MGNVLTFLVLINLHVLMFLFKFIFIVWNTTAYDSTSFMFDGIVLLSHEN